MGKQCLMKSPGRNGKEYENAINGAYLFINKNSFNHLKYIIGDVKKEVKLDKIVKLTK